GIVVAGGQGEGKALTQLSYPKGLFVDHLGTIYVADTGNHRVMRWSKGAKQGTVIARGTGTSKLYYPEGLTIDKHDYLYVVDWGNDRVRRFSIKQCHYDG
ncbi:unnamed protein product, partial [Rotaria sp. Silwood1]